MSAQPQPVWVVWFEVPLAGDRLHQQLYAITPDQEQAQLLTALAQEFGDGLVAPLLERLARLERAETVPLLGAMRLGPRPGLRIKVAPFLEPPDMDRPLEQQRADRQTIA